MFITTYAGYKKKQRIQKNIDNCNFIKTELMILVVLYHSLAIWTGGWFGKPVFENSYFATIAQWLNSLHIYGFVLVSGYIFFFSYCENKKYSNKVRFIERKAMRLLVPYVTVCSIWVVPWSYCYSKLSISTAISSYLLATNPSQLWFLFMLFWVFVIAILIPKWVYDDCIALGIISILLCGIGLVAGTKIPNVFQIWTAFQYFIFFAIGMMLRRYEGGFVWKIPCYLWIVIDIILFVINYFVGKQHGTVFKITRIGMNLLLHIVGAVMAFTVLNAIANKVNWKQNKVIGFLQKHNFAIYLFHQQVIYGVITLLNGEVPSVILALANFVGAIAVSSLISVILHKWKVTRILIGEKG